MAKFSTAFVTNKGFRSILNIFQGNDTLHFTKILAGSGIFDESNDPEKMQNIIKGELQGKIVNIKQKEDSYCILECVFDNQQLDKEFYINEISLFAKSNNEEFLYAYMYAKKTSTDDNNPGDFIPKTSDNIPIEYRINFHVFIGNASNITANIQLTTKAIDVGYDNNVSKLISLNVQEAIDELSGIIDSFNKFNNKITLNHNLNTYPDTVVIQFNEGYGFGKYGYGKYGGSSGERLRTKEYYISKDSMEIWLNKDYGAIKNIVTISDTEYIVTFVNNTLSLYIGLIFNNNQDIVVNENNNNILGDYVSTFNGRAGQVILLESDIPNIDEGSL